MAPLSGQKSPREIRGEPVAAGGLGTLLRVSAEDRAASGPVWALLSSRLQELVESGRLPPGTRIENEVTLAAEVGVSRPTMRRALGDLVDKGLLRRRPGAGTQVVSPSVRRPVALTSLFDDLSRAGREPRTDVLSFEVGPATDALALALRVPPRSDVTTVRRLRYAGGEPLALMSNEVPVSVARLDVHGLQRDGLYRCIQAAGGPLPSTAQEVIGARTATAEECRLLDLPRGAAVLTMTRTAWAADGTGVEVGSHIYRADRYAFEHTVGS